MLRVTITVFYDVRMGIKQGVCKAKLCDNSCRETAWQFSKEQAFHAPQSDANITLVNFLRQVWNVTWNACFLSDRQQDSHNINIISWLIPWILTQCGGQIWQEPDDSVQHLCLLRPHPAPARGGDSGLHNGHQVLQRGGGDPGRQLRQDLPLTAWAPGYWDTDQRRGSASGYKVGILVFYIQNVIG